MPHPAALDALDAACLEALIPFTFPAMNLFPPLSPAAQGLYDSLSRDMADASAMMDDAALGLQPRINARSVYCAAQDARAELLVAVDPEGAAEAERQRQEIGNAYHA